MKEANKVKKIRIIGIGLITILVLIFSWYLNDRFSFSKDLPFYSVKVANDTILTIGIIGDSWVAGAKLDTILHHYLLDKGYKNKVISSGHPGAKSKLIYQNLFKENTEEHSSKFIIESRPQYCIVISGVNDAVTQIGSHFYSYHVRKIIKTLLHYKIKPIIVSLPEFGIQEANNGENFVKRERNVISAYFNNNGEIDNINSYRKVLDYELASENLKDSIILIDFDKVCGDYNKCKELYSNVSHLSRKGNENLCQLITNELTRKLIEH